MPETTTATTNAAPGQEPSMEEILASIRRIIAEDEPAQAAPAAAGDADEPIELTEIVDAGSGSDLVMTEDPPAAPDPEPLPEASPPPPEPETLVSTSRIREAASALSSLANTVEVEQRMAVRPLPLGDGARTVESMVTELLRPMLREWLDENLPLIVERLVQREIDRMARRVGDKS